MNKQSPEAFWRINKKIKKNFVRTQKLLAIFVFVAILVSIYANWETYRIEIKKTDLETGNIPAEFSGKKIIFISDVHCGEYFNPERLRKIVAQINSLVPDLVLLGGDYVSRNGKHTEACFTQYAKINAPLGKFGVLGNHDIEAGKEKTLEAMSAAGITPLVNENHTVKISAGSITIAGVDETWYGAPNGAATMKNATDFTIYLSHDPAYFEKQFDNRAKLLLAGHTHGGQVTLFGISFANLAHWHNYKYGKGIFEDTGRTIIVSNGIGATILPLRFFARPQINLIIIKKI